MSCTCCLRRNTLPINCNCDTPGICRVCLLCARHCRCLVKPLTPACVKPKPPVTRP